jgi:ribonuclease PH
LVDGELLLDLCYQEDSAADVDFNVVMTGDGDLVELQGTAEGMPFGRPVVDRLLDLAERGIGQLSALQRQALAAGAGVDR